jgi:hypothetical protein
MTNSETLTTVLHDFCAEVTAEVSSLLPVCGDISSNADELYCDVLCAVTWMHRGRFPTAGTTWTRYAKTV